MKTLRRLLPLLLLLFTLHVHAQQPAGDGGRETTPAANSPRANEAEIDETIEYKQSAVVKKMASMMHTTPATAAMIFEIVNFAILAGAILFFLGKALPKTFRARTSGIQKDLVDARTATEEASQRLNSVEERLAKLDGRLPRCANSRARHRGRRSTHQGHGGGGIEENPRRRRPGNRRRNRERTAPAAAVCRRARHRAGRAQAHHLG